jgi:hypothetical protein
MLYTITQHLTVYNTARCRVLIVVLLDICVLCDVVLCRWVSGHRHQELLAHWHSIMSHKTWIVNIILTYTLFSMYTRYDLLFKHAV